MREKDPGFGWSRVFQNLGDFKSAREESMGARLREALDLTSLPLDSILHHGHVTRRRSGACEEEKSSAPRKREGAEVGCSPSSFPHAYFSPSQAPARPKKASAEEKQMFSTTFLTNIHRVVTQHLKIVTQHLTVVTQHLKIVSQFVVRKEIKVACLVPSRFLDT